MTPQSVERPISMTDERRDALLALAERCEAAAGPGRHLDAAIAKALELPHGKDSGWCNSENGDHWVVEECASQFTASIDAALTLLPGPDWEWKLEWETNSDGEMFARCELGDPMRFRDCEAPTLALAICAAALRARASA